MWSTLLVSLFLDGTSSGTLSAVPFALQDIGSAPGRGGGDDDGSSPIREWSSTIGIVTAIVGNVLISFALNIQRYAHIRIARDLERKRGEDGWKNGSPGFVDNREGRTFSDGSYGTVPHGDGGQSGLGSANTQVRDSTEIQRGSHDEARQLTPRLGAGPVHRAGHTDADDTSDDGTDPLKQSFLSERTVTSLEKSSSPRARKSYLRSPYWWTGIILMTVGEAGNFLAYGFAPASIVSPLGVVALVSNCVIAPIMLKEKFRQQDFWGVLVAIGGAVTVVFSANTREEKIGPDDIIGMITRWEFELYLGLTIGMILVLMWVSKKHGQKTILIDLGLVGLFGGYTALSTKGVSSLLSYTLWHVITYPITYVLVAVLVLSAMMQIRYINRALQRFDSTQVIPTQFVIFTISVIVGSTILYRDFESATLKQGLQFLGGCALTFLGVYMITSGRSRGEEDQESDQDEEEAIGLLHGTRYRDSIEWHGQTEPHQQADQVITEQGRQSGPGSLLSEHGLHDEEDEDGLRTPRAPLSSSPASLPPSISDASLMEPPEGSPEAHTAYPWAQRREERLQSMPADLRPSTPPPPPTNVIFQFPTAPGVTESPRGTLVSDVPKLATNTGRSRRHTISRAPRSSSRTRLSLRFSPGPLLPPLSGGLSAVVAESLRRGEGSPEKQRGQRQQHRRRIKSTPNGERSAGPNETTEQDVAYETDTSLFGEGQPSPQRNGLSRTHSLGPPLSFRLPFAPIVRDGSNADSAGEHHHHDGESPARYGHGRKDSWTENLTRFGASLRQSGRRWSRLFKDDDEDDGDAHQQGQPASSNSHEEGEESRDRDPTQRSNVQRDLQ